VWSESVGAWGRLDGNGNAAPVDRSTGGTFLGVDGTFEGTWRLGIAGGYTHSDFDLDRRRSSGSLESYHAAGYGGLQLGGFGARLGGVYTWHDAETRRTIDVGSFADRTTAQRDARTAQVFAELGYGLAFEPVAIEPFAGLSYVHLETDRFRETGGDAALAGFAGDADLTTSTLGLRSAIRVLRTESIDVALRAVLGWRHAFSETRPTARLAFREGGTPFTVAGAPIARDSAAVDVRLDLGLGASARLGLGYKGEIASNARDHAVVAELSIKF
jgi:outer membrane autotransporter protein